MLAGRRVRAVLMVAGSSVVLAMLAAAPRGSGAGEGQSGAAGAKSGGGKEW